jgi:N-acetylmuramoyl-L-alanine amidase
VNLAIAQATAEKLKELGYEVDILPAVVPPSYRAHLFIAIHADGSNDPNAAGYRVATPRRDATGRASQFAELLEKSYGEATELRQLPTVTRRMRNYYAFNFRRYEHALHPMTIGVIIETGFITSPRDRRVIMDDPEKAATGIVDAITAFPITPPPKKPGGEGVREAIGIRDSSFKDPFSVSALVLMDSSSPHRSRVRPGNARATPFS